MQNVWLRHETPAGWVAPGVAGMVTLLQVVPSHSCASGCVEDKVDPVAMQNVGLAHEMNIWLDDRPLVGDGPFIAVQPPCGEADPTAGEPTIAAEPAQSAVTATNHKNRRMTPLNVPTNHTMSPAEQNVIAGSCVFYGKKGPPPSRRRRVQALPTELTKPFTGLCLMGGCC
jgi:hypothetical protein